MADNHTSPRATPSSCRVFGYVGIISVTGYLALIHKLVGQDFDPGRGWEYSRLCSVTPLVE